MAKTKIDKKKKVRDINIRVVEENIETSLSQLDNVDNQNDIDTLNATIDVITTKMKLIATQTDELSELMEDDTEFEELLRSSMRF